MSKRGEKLHKSPYSIHKLNATAAASADMLHSTSACTLLLISSTQKGHVALITPC